MPIITPVTTSMTMLGFTAHLRDDFVGCHVSEVIRSESFRIAKSRATSYSSPLLKPARGRIEADTSVMTRPVRRSGTSLIPLKMYVRLPSSSTLTGEANRVLGNVTFKWAWSLGPEA